MPFKETSVSEETLRFVTAYLSGMESMVDLCARFGISRTWGYELVGRYRLSGVSGLVPRSRAPHCHGRSMSHEVASAILELRCERPSWGPKKLRAALARRQPEQTWPAASTIGDLLRRHGLSQARRRRRRALPLSRPFAPVRAPNDLWCIDFKGWFRTADGARCDPLTLSDADSRFLLICRHVRPDSAGAEPLVEAALRRYGLPLAVRSDNGPPFAGRGAGGLTRLAVKWIKLGIRLERTDPGSPQQNARHERMHATLKAETATPPAESLAAQQRRFQRFRQDFNNERPHEALGQETPSSRYQSSPRAYPGRIEEPVYDADQAVRRVRSNGEIKWRGELIFLSEALVGEPVGLAETDSGDWIVRFADNPIAIIQRQSKRLIPFAPARPGKAYGNRKQNGKTVSDLSGQ